MKIATWNVERLKSKRKLASIIEQIEKVNPEILILTEYHQLIKFSNYDFEIGTTFFAKDERKVMIFSKFPIIRKIETYNEFTSCCAEFETEKGIIIIYGTVVGVLGNRRTDYSIEIKKQAEDINRLSKSGNFCYVGDLNMTFSDNYYYTKLGRKLFVDCFEKNYMTNLTENLSETIDHIVITRKFVEKRKQTLYEWNLDKTLSDHKGICVNIE